MTRVTIKADAVADTYAPEEAAWLLSRGVATIWRRIRDEKILAVRIGGRTLIPKRENRKAPEAARPTEPSKPVGLMFANVW